MSRKIFIECGDLEKLLDCHDEALLLGQGLISAERSQEMRDEIERARKTP